MAQYDNMAQSNAECTHTDALKYMQQRVGLCGIDAHLLAHLCVVALLVCCLCAILILFRWHQLPSFHGLRCFLFLPRPSPHHYTLEWATDDTGPSNKSSLRVNQHVSSLSDQSFIWSGVYTTPKPLAYTNAPQQQSSSHASLYRI